MTELRPLLESSSNPRTRELLRAGLGERPPARAVEATAAALGVTVSLSASTAGATALAGATASVATEPLSISAMAIVKWLSVGALSGTAVAGASAYVQYESTGPGPDEARTAPVLAQASASRARLATEPRKAQTAPVDGSSGTARRGADSEATQRSPNQVLPSPIPKATLASPSDGGDVSERTSQLSLELSLIDRARASLAAGAAEQALGELSAYDKTRATGTLDREAWILRIDALLRLGKNQEARALARSYLERFPRDAHAARLLELARGE